MEFYAVLARRNREGDIDAGQFEALKLEFAQDWVDYLHVETCQELLEMATELAEAFSLRAYDSVHLAATRHLHERGKLPVMFACFDKRLNLAAKMLGLQLINLP